MECYTFEVMANKIWNESKKMWLSAIINNVTFYACLQNVI